MGNNRVRDYQISGYSSILFGAIVLLFLCIIGSGSSANFLAGETSEKHAIALKENAPASPTFKDTEGNNITEKGLHYSVPPFPYKINGSTTSTTTKSPEVIVNYVDQGGGEPPEESSLEEEEELLLPWVNNSAESSSSKEDETGEMKINGDIAKWVEHRQNLKEVFGNTLDSDVIIQAFKFIKLDSHLGLMESQMTRMQDSHDTIQRQITKHDAKFDLLLDRMESLVNFVLEESAKVRGKEDKIEAEIQTMNNRLDQAVQNIIQSSTTSNVMFELAKESLLQLKSVEEVTEKVLEAVKGVKTDLGDVGQASVQTMHNLNKLEETLIAGLDEAGNRTVYALRQDAKIIGPTVLLQDGYEGNSIPYQADQSFGGSPTSVKKLSLGESTKAESLVSCLSRKRLINGEKRPRDCGDIQVTGHIRSGVYKIFPTINSDHQTEVYCDLDTLGGGWTIIQRRVDARENFYRTWKEYKEGFGSPAKQSWIGLENIAELTKSGDQELRVELTDWAGESREANYGYFRVANASDKFRLHVADYSGSAGDSLAYHNGMAFSTRDSDNDLETSTNCAERYQGGWWFKNCHQSNLNGLYVNGGRHQSYAMGLNWYAFRGYYYSLKQVQMKIRNRSFATLQLDPQK